MPERNNMNDTSLTLREQCSAVGIPIAAHRPTVAEVLPIIEQRLAAHLRDAIPENSCDYPEWKSQHDNLQELLARLKPSTPGDSPTSIPSIESSPSIQSIPSRASAPSRLCVNPLSEPNEPTETQPVPNRHKTGPTGQPIADQQNLPASNREKSGTEPGQNREPAQNPPKSLQNTTPTAAPTPKCPPPPPTSDPCDTSESEPSVASSAEKLDRAAFQARLQKSKSDMAELAQCAIDHGVLPDPKKCALTEYTNAFFDLAGPPRPRRLDQLDPQIRAMILALIEDHKYKYVQDKLMLPPPFGPYILTSKSSLSRLKTSQHAREARRSNRALKREITDLAKALEVAKGDYNAVTEKLLQVRLMEATLHPSPDLAQTKTLIDMLEKIRAGKLAERKQTLAEQSE
jgi:hypothetical protein